MTELQQLELSAIDNQATFCSVGLSVPETITLDGWADIGKKLCRTTRMMQWWVGDWAAYGERRFGKLSEFATVNGLNYQRLKEYAQVSEAVQPTLRKEGLDWAYYKEVAGLPPKEQKQWLDKAEAEHWTVAELREKIRLALGEAESKEHDKPIGLDCLRWRDSLVHWFKTRPDGFWTEDRKAVWRKELAPIVQFYHSLGT